MNGRWGRQQRSIALPDELAAARSGPWTQWLTPAAALAERGPGVGAARGKRGDQRAGRGRVRQGPREQPAVGAGAAS